MFCTKLSKTNEKISFTLFVSTWNNENINNYFLVENEHHNEIKENISRK